MGCAGYTDMERWAKVGCKRSEDAFQVTLSESFCLQYLSLGLWYSQPDNPYSLGPYQWSADHHRTVCMGRVLPVDWVSYQVMVHLNCPSRVQLSTI